MSIPIKKRREVVKLLSILFKDETLLSRAHAVNSDTVKYTEQLMNDLIFCNRATTLLMAGIRCVPKSKNVYGWLLGCLPALLNLFKVYENEMQASLFCSVHVIEAQKSGILITLL